MTNRLARLESAGLVERAVDQHDRRSLQVSLTKRGKSLIEQAVGTHTDIQNQLLLPLSIEQQHVLAELLKKVLAYLPGESSPDE
jgi:DNA-binding MarR family transcriptional regulator